MTDKEKNEMMAEIMNVVNKHVAKSEGKVQNENTNKYGREFGIADDAMARWREEYKRMRVEGKKILEEVRNHPIDISQMHGAPTFSLDAQILLLK